MHRRVTCVNPVAVLTVATATAAIAATAVATTATGVASMALVGVCRRATKQKDTPVSKNNSRDICTHRQAHAHTSKHMQCMLCTSKCRLALLLHISC